MAQYLACGRAVERHVVVLVVHQGDRAVAAHVDVVDLDVRFPVAEVVLCGQRIADGVIAAVVVDCRYVDCVEAVVVKDREQFQVAHHGRRQELLDETFVLVVAHRLLQRVQPRAADDHKASATACSARKSPILRS